MKKNAIPHSGPDFTLETALGALNGRLVAGLDEAGRGPWAGPVVAAAVILDPKRIPSGLNDSKKLTAAARERLFAEINRVAHVGVGIVSAATIDEINILQASLLAMSRAVEALKTPPVAALVDGLHCPKLACTAKAVVKGDSRSLSIAAASIIAKVTRDAMMVELASEFPGYGWERNMGYGVPAHAAALAEKGVTIQHRRSFAPIKAALAAITTCTPAISDGFSEATA
jgi:ribonuclease HII